jgi:hypothetical protein
MYTPTSKFLQLNARDLILGIIMALVTSLLAGIIKILETGTDFTWVNLKPVMIAGICAGLTYLLKNLVSNSRGELLRRD